MLIDRLSQSWHKAKVLLATVLVCGSLTLPAPKALAQFQGISEPPLTGFPGPNPADNPITFYVSKSGNNADGKSWATAWTDMDQIQWAQIRVNNPHGSDRIVIDGGARRMIYRKPLKVQVTNAYFGFSISVSTEAGHNGQAVIAPPADSIGIEVSNVGGITLTGSRRSGILVYGAKDGLVMNGTAPMPVNITNIEISHCNEAGVKVSSPYFPMTLSQLVVHDCATNVLVPTAGFGPAGPVLNKCWIYNSSYAPNSDGVRVDPSSSVAPSLSSITVTNCVIGPGLRDGISCLTPSNVIVTNCLLIDATRANVSAAGARLENVTSFMTRLNPHNLAHSALKLRGPGNNMYYPTQPSWVKRSIVYGGLIDVPLTIQSFPYNPQTGPTMVPFPITSENNTQFRTTGNTAVISATMVDPRFTTPVGLLPGFTPVRFLMEADFSLRAGSPALGTGSTITSVRSLLNSFN